MAIDSETLQKLSEIDMPAEAFRQVVAVLASVTAKEEARKQKDRERKRIGKSAENPRKIQEYSMETSAECAPESLPDKEAPHTPKEINPSHTSLRSELSSARAEEIFETEFWPEYPKRNGTNPKNLAREKFVAHVRRGVDPAEIIAGLKAYAVFMADDDPKFVMQATKFLNQKCWQDDYSVRAQGPPKPKQETWEDTANWFLRGEDDDGSRREESAHGVVELSREDWSGG